jgi:hypothetical protein
MATRYASREIWKSDRVEGVFEDIVVCRFEASARKKNKNKNKSSHRDVSSGSAPPANSGIVKIVQPQNQLPLVWASATECATTSDAGLKFVSVELEHARWTLMEAWPRPASRAELA